MSFRAGNVIEINNGKKYDNYMYLEKPLQEYLADLASAKPTPGGGSAAALSGAMAAALVCMVARLTLSKADYADVHAEIETLLQDAEQVRERFQQLMQADIDAYGRLSASFKMPRATEQERAERTQSVQAALLSAALVPLEMAEQAAQLIQYGRRIAEIGNKNVLSDIATATALASGGGTGASWMVRTNLHSVKDLQQVEALTERLSVALDTITTYSQQTVSIVGERS
ncbi:MAG: cyclodeaminase/cyclohydrolase family protein [Ktedonobacteraceae bacterium]